MSLNGAYLFLMSVLVVGSGLGSWRPEVFGLLVHPYLVPLGLVVPFLVGRFADVPLRILVTMFAFAAMYCFSSLNGGYNPLGEVFKMTSAMLTILVYAVMMRRREDMVPATLGMAIGVAILGIRGLGTNTVAGVMAIDVANKNAYSLYALPVLLLIGYVCLNMKSTSVTVKAALMACAIPILGAIFMSGNRSGYVGVVLVALMLLWERRGKGLLLVGTITAAVALLIWQFGSTAMIEDRWEVTVAGKNDQIRFKLLRACFNVGLNNPLTGVGPQVLQFEIAKLPSTQGRLPPGDSHNAFMQIWGGSGVICFAASWRWVGPCAPGKPLAARPRAATIRCAKRGE